MSRAHVFGIAAIMTLGAVPALGNAVYQSLPYSRNWGQTALLATNDDWTQVPGVVGYLGEDLTITQAGLDPRTITADGAYSVDVTVDQTDPTALVIGGVAEFELADPVVALLGSTNADFPNLVFYLNTTGWKFVGFSCVLRDIDGSASNSVQPVALQYRVGGSGSWTNVPGGYVADATAGPGVLLSTPLAVMLPAACGNQPRLQLRVLTANAVGNDEWVGIDDILIGPSTSGVPEGPSVQRTTWSGIKSLFR